MKLKLREVNEEIVTIIHDNLVQANITEIIFSDSQKTYNQKFAKQLGNMRLLKKAQKSSQLSEGPSARYAPIQTISTELLNGEITQLHASLQVLQKLTDEAESTWPNKTSKKYFLKEIDNCIKGIFIEKKTWNACSARIVKKTN